MKDNIFTQKGYWCKASSLGDKLPHQLYGKFDLFHIDTTHVSLNSLKLMPAY